MACYFLDSSAVFKRYVVETGTPWVVSLTDPAAAHQLFVVSITGVEVVSALVRQIPPLPASDLATALANFKHDYQTVYQVITISSVLITRAMALAEKHHLRGYDAVQLAAGTLLHAATLTKGVPAPVFVSADRQLNAAAAVEGLTVDDPSAHP